MRRMSLLLWSFFCIPFALFFMLVFVSEVRSGAGKLLPVVIAPCVCATLVVCVPDEDESLAAPVSSAQGGPWLQNLEER